VISLRFMLTILAYHQEIPFKFSTTTIDPQNIPMESTNLFAYLVTFSIIPSRASNRESVVLLIYSQHGEQAAESGMFTIRARSTQGKRKKEAIIITTTTTNSSMEENHTVTSARSSDIVIPKVSVTEKNLYSATLQWEVDMDDNTLLYRVEKMNENGTYVPIWRGHTRTFRDNTLSAASEYFYRVKVNENTSDIVQFNTLSVKCSVTPHEGSCLGGFPIVMETNSKVIATDVIQFGEETVNITKLEITKVTFLCPPGFSGNRVEVYIARFPEFRASFTFTSPKKSKDEEILERIKALEDSVNSLTSNMLLLLKTKTEVIK